MMRNDFTLLLPGRWARLELEDDGRLRSGIREYLLAAGGRRDDQTLLRAELRARLLRAARRARDAGGTHQFLGVELSPGVPFPAVLTVSWPLVRLLEPDPEPVRLRQLVAAADPDAVAFPIGPSPAVRTCRRSRRPALEEEGAPEVEGLTIDYWVGVPGTARVALFSASVPLVTEEASLVDLFTVIMTSLRWEV